MSLRDETFAAEHEQYQLALVRECALHPELQGKMFRPKNVDGNPFKNYIPMSFSMTLVDLAGGVRMLLEWWEAE